MQKDCSRRAMTLRENPPSDLCESECSHVVLHSTGMSQDGQAYHYEKVSKLHRIFYGIVDRMVHRTSNQFIIVPNLYRITRGEVSSTKLRHFRDGLGCASGNSDTEVIDVLLSAGRGNERFQVSGEVAPRLKHEVQR